jgi:hypothetical protein
MRLHHGKAEVADDRLGGLLLLPLFALHWGGCGMAEASGRKNSLFAALDHCVPRGRAAPFLKKFSRRSRSVVFVHSLLKHAKRAQFALR